MTVCAELASAEWLGHLNEAVLLIRSVEYWGLEGFFGEGNHGEQNHLDFEL